MVFSVRRKILLFICEDFIPEHALGHLVKQIDDFEFLDEVILLYKTLDTNGKLTLIRLKINTMATLVITPNVLAQVKVKEMAMPLSTCMELLCQHYNGNNLFIKEMISCWEEAGAGKKIEVPVKLLMENNTQQLKENIQCFIDGVCKSTVTFQLT